MLRARLFGPLSIALDERPVPDVAGLRPRALLAWLLLHPGRHPRAHLAARFWPDVLDTSARASLRSALWTVRAALDAVDAGAYLDADRNHVGLRDDLPHEIDVETFARLARSDGAADLERALALAQPPLLSDLAEDWVLEARDEYRARAAGVALRLADRAESAGDPRAAAAWARRALAHTRLDEAVHRRLIELLSAAGERAAALAAYERCRTMLAAEFGVAPSAETRAVAAGVRSRQVRAPGAHGAAHARAPLVGRRHELAALAGAWRSALGERGGVALVTGSAGIGKTRLVDELAHVAEGHGGCHAVGRASNLPGASPLSLWTEVLTSLAAAAPAPPRDALWAADLERLCPAVELAWGHRAADPGPDPAVERVRAFESVAAALEWCARTRPVLVVLEDVHDADRTSLALLVHVARRLGRAPVLVVATRRPVDRHDVRLVLDAMARGPALIADVALGPLGDADLDAVVRAAAARLDPAVRRRVVDVAGGNPLVARQAALSAARGDDPAAGLATWAAGLRTALPDDGRLVADVVAAAGRPLRPPELLDAVGAEQLGDAVAEPVALQILEVGDGEAVGFSHGLLRQAWYEQLGVAARAALHRRLADALAARPDRRVAEVARHLVLAHDDERARSYLATAAAHARAMGGLGDAAAFLAEAVELAPAAAAELWLELAEVEAWRGNRAAHDAAFSRAEPLLRARADAVALAGACVLRGRLLRTTLCYPREALAAYDRALDMLDAPGVEAPELRALALAGAAWAEGAGGDVERAAALIERAEQLPEVAADPALAAELELDRATVLMRRRRFTQAEAPVLRAAELAASARRSDLHALACNLGASAAAARGSVERALELASRAAAAGRAGTTLEMEAQAARAYALARLGRHGEAREAARAEASIALRAGDREGEAMAAFDAGSVALSGGDGDAAVEHLSAALGGDARRVPRALGRLRLAEARLLTGDVHGAAEEVGRVPFDPVAAVDMPDALVPRLERLQGLVAAARGDRREGQRRLCEAERGWRRLAAGAGARDLLAASLVDLGRAPVAGLVEPAVELGRVLAERAVLLAENGDVDEAEAAAAEAEKLAATAGFDGYREAIDRARGAARRYPSARL